jgi:hypothetical protein
MHHTKAAITVLAISLSFALSSQAMSLFTSRTPEYVTNQISSTAIATNPITGVLTTNVLISQIVQTQVVYQVSPALQTASAVGGTASQFLPAPYGAVLSSILAIFLAGAAKYASDKNNELSAAQQAVDTTTSMLTATIAGVESVGDAATKAAIQSHSVAAGVAADLRATVSQVTSPHPATVQTILTSPTTKSTPPASQS